MYRHMLALYRYIYNVYKAPKCPCLKLYVQLNVKKLCTEFDFYHTCRMGCPVAAAGLEVWSSLVVET